MTGRVNKIIPVIALGVVVTVVVGFAYLMYFTKPLFGVGFELPETEYYVGEVVELRPYLIYYGYQPVIIKHAGPPFFLFAVWDENEKMVVNRLGQSLSLITPTIHPQQPYYADGTYDFTFHYFKIEQPGIYRLELFAKFYRKAPDFIPPFLGRLLYRELTVYARPFLIKVAAGP
ncbi:MAG: hypothetical protein DDT41_01752 [candidate division WS2 bacterium]|nr:hypothetical protein [Candidatus Psychracetigena formicireducens]